MSTEQNNQEEVVDSTTNEVESDAETISLAKAEYDKLNQTLGSLKRELKEAKKAKETTETTTKNDKESDDFGLLELTFLKGEGIMGDEESAFVKEQLKLAGFKKDQLPKLLSNPYFKAELETLRTAKANQVATSNIRGEKAGSDAQNTPEYWIGKGELPPQTPANRKLRAKIALEHIRRSKTGKQFYNE